MRGLWNGWVPTGLVAGLVVGLALSSTGGCGSGATSSGDGTVILGPNDLGGNRNANSENDNGATTNANDNAPPANVNANTAPPENENDNSLGDGNACAAISGRSFFTSTASLSFVAGQFIWTISGTQVEGVFDCVGLNVIGAATDGSAIQGSYDPLTDTLIWDGAVYRPRVVQP
jgi:hypothetical protein